MLKEEKVNYVEKKYFLENEHKSLLERNNVLPQEIEQQRKKVLSM